MPAVKPLSIHEFLDWDSGDDRRYGEILAPARLAVRQLTLRRQAAHEFAQQAGTGDRNPLAFLRRRRAADRETREQRHVCVSEVAHDDGYP